MLTRLLMESAYNRNAALSSSTWAHSRTCTLRATLMFLVIFAQSTLGYPLTARNFENRADESGACGILRRLLVNLQSPDQSLFDDLRWINEINVERRQSGWPASCYCSQRVQQFCLLSALGDHRAAMQLIVLTLASIIGKAFLASFPSAFTLGQRNFSYLP